MNLGGGGTAPVTPEIELVAGPAGGSVEYAVTLANTTTQAHTFRAEVNVTLPDGSVYGPLQEPRTVTLGPNQSVGPVLFTAPVPPGAPTGTYTVTLALSSGGAVFASDSFSLTSGAAQATDVAGVRAQVEGAYPNPFTTATTIRFETGAVAAEVHLAVYDVLGREVAVLVDEQVEARVHEAVFDGRGLPSGVYVWRLTVGGQVQTGRLTLLR